MARNPSAMKYQRQSEVLRARNRARKSMIRTFTNKALSAAQAGKADDAAKYQKVAVSLIDRASKGSTLHKNTAARKKSRLAKQINKYSASA